MTATRNLLATAPSDPYLIALEITHPDLAVPIRVVADTQDIVIEGNTYTACAFQLTKPDDVDQQLPHATLAVDNIGRELTQWLEYSRGGRGAMCRIIGGTRTGRSKSVGATSAGMTATGRDTYIGDKFTTQPGELWHVHGAVNNAASTYNANIGVFFMHADGSWLEWIVAAGVAPGQSGELDGFIAAPANAAWAQFWLQLNMPGGTPGQQAVWTALAMNSIGALDIDEDMTLAMSDMAITPLVVTANLGMQKSLGQPAVAVRYDPTTAIGIFD